MSLYQDHLAHLNKQFKLPVIIVRETREKGRGRIGRTRERGGGGWEEGEKKGKGRGRGREREKIITCSDFSEGDCFSCSASKCHAHPIKQLPKVIKSTFSLSILLIHTCKYRDKPVLLCRASDLMAGTEQTPVLPWCVE